MILHGEQFMAPEHADYAHDVLHQVSGVGRGTAGRRDRDSRRRDRAGRRHVAPTAPRRRIRFYEIDPRVLIFAPTRLHLSEVKAAAGIFTVVLGDARLSLEREPPQGFDVLAVDAFSGDAIPAHLITREAFGQYLSHMKPDGIVVFHVSNRFLDLEPVVGAAGGANRARTRWWSTRRPRRRMERAR